MSSTVFSAIAFGGAGVLTTTQVRWWVDERRARRGAREQVGLAEQPNKPAVRTIPRPVALVSAPLEKRRERRRSEQISLQLAPALQLIVGHLRIGRNVVSAITEVGESSPEPLRSVLMEVIAEARLGTPIDEALQSAADREGGRHLSIVASAVGLQSRLGGSLVEILDTVIDTIEEEDRLRRDIKSLTADGRLSAQILLAMPPVMFVVVSILSPGYAEPLLTDPLGRFMLGTAVLLALVGWRWLRALSSPRVVA